VNQKTAKMFEYLKNLNDSMHLPKNMRIGTILVAIYQLLIAHVACFVLLLGLINAEQISQLLSQDIEEQLEKEDYFYYGPTNKNGDTMNIVRFKTASKLASKTLVVLYIGSTFAALYLMCCFSLMIGVLKNRANLMVPWMVFNLFSSIFFNSCMVIFGTKIVHDNFNISRELFWVVCFSVALTDMINWYIVYQYYKSVRHMSKLREEMVIPIPIPCPPPNFNKQQQLVPERNPYCLKHTLFDLNINEYNYIA
jgi:hypothetical protein